MTFILSSQSFQFIFIHFYCKPTLSPLKLLNAFFSSENPSFSSYLYSFAILESSKRNSASSSVLERKGFYPPERKEAIYCHYNRSFSDNQAKDQVPLLVYSMKVMSLERKMGEELCLFVICMRLWYWKFIFYRYWLRDAKKLTSNF